MPPPDGVYSIATPTNGSSGFAYLRQRHREKNSAMVSVEFLAPYLLRRQNMECNIPPLTAFRGKTTLPVNAKATATGGFLRSTNTGEDSRRPVL
ncbi:MAG: hypothetical protein JWR22_1310 [Herminiimonas sp.]|nr:hypothetical protein [Herminiimonas sp.]